MTPLVSSLPILTVQPLDAPVVGAPGGAEEAFVLILSQQGNSAESLVLSDQKTAEAPFNGGTLSKWWPEQETTEQVATDAQVCDALAAHVSDHAGPAIALVPIEGPAVVHQPSTPFQACVCDDIRIPPVALPNLVLETSGQSPEPLNAAEGKAPPIPIQEKGPSDPETRPWPRLERVLPLTMSSFSRASSAAVLPQPSSPQPSMPDSAPAAPASLSFPTQTLPRTEAATPTVVLPTDPFAKPAMSPPPLAFGEVADQVITPELRPVLMTAMPMASAPVAAPLPSRKADVPFGIASNPEWLELVAPPWTSRLVQPKPSDHGMDGPPSAKALPSDFVKVSLHVRPVTVSAGFSLAVAVSPGGQQAAVSDENPQDVTEGNPPPVTQSAQTPQSANISPIPSAQLNSVDVQSGPASVAQTPLAHSAYASRVPPLAANPTSGDTAKTAPQPMAPLEVTFEKSPGLTIAEHDTAVPAVATLGVQDTARPDRPIPMARTEVVVQSPQAQVAAAVAVAHDQTVELLLAPEELGQVRIDLRRDGETIVVSVSAERQDTLDLLRRNADQLALDLRAASQAGVSLSFGRWTGSEGGAPGHGQTSQADDAADGPTLQPNDTGFETASASVPVAGLYLRI